MRDEGFAEEQASRAASQEMSRRIREAAGSRLRSEGGT